MWGRSTGRTVICRNRAFLARIETAFPLSLYGYCTLQNMLRKASLLEKVSPADLLEEFFSIYAITDGERTIVTEVPKRARELDEQLDTNLFPKTTNRLRTFYEGLFTPMSKKSGYLVSGRACCG